MRQLVAAVFLVAISVTLLGTFSAMWLLDKVHVCEPHVAVRAIEVFVFLGIALFSLYHLIKTVREVLKR